jgi:hypothetical protein
MAAEYRVDYYTGETFYNENMSFRPDIYNAIKAEELPPLLRLSSYDRESQDDIIVYTWDKQDISKKQKIEMRKNNDFSYRQKALFKKVGSYNAGYGKINYIYKIYLKGEFGIHYRLYNENKEKDQESVALAFYYAKQAEKVKNNNNQFWTGLKQIHC